jgi:hypothetical protein
MADLAHAYATQEGQGLSETPEEVIIILPFDFRRWGNAS